MSNSKPEHPYRVVVEQVRPDVNWGRHPAKRTVGERVTVEADIIADGHDTLAAVLRVRHTAPGARPGPWQESPMTLVNNDLWTGGFLVEAMGRYEYVVAAWVDRFASWRHELEKKYAAGQDVASELLEGAHIVARTAEALAPPASKRRRGTDAGAADAAGGRTWLADRAAALAADAPQPDRVGLALDDELASRMARHAPRGPVSTSEPVRAVEVDRERARTGAWYEMFPRSATRDPSRGATLREAADDLPRIAAMGFDVVYLPPVHPIGTSFRKGPNNTLSANPDDPGSPWAIGSAEGGHDAVHPELGTIDDFLFFQARAHELGLEVALDIAFQCSPDHPYVSSNPEWFRHRPDGTIKYAENPPKKYQDIYPLDFETDAWPALWDELKRVVLFWVERGVRLLRVDNPHTKPFAFWKWLIAEVRREYPDTVFLSEAFTRPKVMKHLAKIGFQQSYSYFTWRTGKAELTEYFTELYRTDVVEYLRPNLFANTPDILHEYLQRGGRPAFEVRLVLAATLGANYGIYSGFELAENRPVRPGSEEYLDSEKYQIRVRDWHDPVSIAQLITEVNAIRHAYPALQHDRFLEFHDTDNGQLLAYSKSAPDGTGHLLMVVNLDVVNMQHGTVAVPIDRWNLPAAGYWAEDLLSGERYFWQGDRNYVRLDPGFRAAHILRLFPATE